ncbi:MAG: diguanylate cyclase [Desulfuromusa sp.]|nr:diguanylate cyclase [Desulfuromusa sp.]
MNFRRAIFSLFLFFCFCFVTVVEAKDLEKVTLQLDWKFQFEFAGFIAAIEKGFYEEAGLDVTLLEYQAGSDTVENVLNHTVNYGIHNSSLVIANEKIQPIVLLATYFQRSPLIFVSKPEIKNPNDLLGKTIMGTKDEFKYSSLALLLNHFYIDSNNSNIVEHSFSIDDFADGKVDAITAFRSNQIFDLDQMGIEYNIIDPASYGFFMSAVNLFTSKEEALNQPDRTQRFIDASNKGWEYALTYSDELIKVIHEKYAPHKSIAALTFEVEVTKDMFLRGFYPVGAVNAELTTRVYKQLIERKMLDKEQNLGPYLFEDMLKTNHRNLNFTVEEQNYLRAKKEITLCVDPEWMPFERIKDNQHIGIAADYMTFFQEKLSIPMRLVQTTSWQQSIQFAKERKCDIYTLAASTPERLEYMNFTSPYLSLPVVLATKTDKFFIENIHSVLQEKLGVVEGYAIAETLKSEYPQVNIVEVRSITDGLEKVESGEIYGYIDNLMTIARSVQKDFTGVIKVSGRLKENIDLAIGTRNDEPLLNSIFEKLIGSITPEKKQAIFNKWVSIKQDMGFDYSLFWKIFAGLGVLIVAFSFHYRQLRKYNRLLQTLSITDKLTGLHNRAKLDEVLIEQEHLYRRYNTDCGLILLDIDHFKQVNDVHGHLTGDRILVEFSQILQKHIRTTDIVGRWGGEEFLIIAANTGIKDCGVLAEKLLALLRKETFDGVGLITASFGVSSFTKGESTKETLALADRSLYRAKANGRNRVEIST